MLVHDKVEYPFIAAFHADMHAYQDIRLQLEGESGRINGRFAELDWTPILYIHKQYERSVLAALFRTAHVGQCIPPMLNVAVVMAYSPPSLKYPVLLGIVQQRFGFAAGFREHGDLRPPTHHSHSAIETDLADLLRCEGDNRRRV